MNCRQGDLAVLVRPLKEFKAGTVLTCLRLYPSVVAGLSDGSRGEVANIWETDLPPIPAWPGLPTGIKDSWLRPLRDTDGDDETLTWAGKPSTINQPTKENV